MNRNKVLLDCDTENIFMANGRLAQMMNSKLIHPLAKSIQTESITESEFYHNFPYFELVPRGTWGCFVRERERRGSFS